MSSSYDNGCDDLKKRFENYSRTAYPKISVRDTHYTQDAHEYMEMDKASSSGYFRKEPQPDDKQQRGSHTEIMNDITREEFNAKLETIEARMDARVESVSSKIDAFLNTQSAVQVERDKAQAERDKRFEAIADRAAKAAEGAEEAARQAATVKANYWAAVIVQLLAVVAILVGAYFANQANVLGVMQTTMAAMQAGRDSAEQRVQAAPPPPASVPPPAKQK